MGKSPPSCPSLIIHVENRPTEESNVLDSLPTEAHNNQILPLMEEMIIHVDSTFLPENQPSTSSAYTDSYSTLNKRFHDLPSTSSYFNCPIETISPIPKTDNTTRKSRLRGKAAVLTDSPYKNELSKRKKMSKFKSTTSSKPKTKRVLLLNETSSSEEDDDATCIFCKSLYSTSRDGWVACLQSKLWANESCAGVDDEDTLPYVCDYCQNTK